MTLQDKLSKLPPQARRAFIQRYIDKANDEEDNVQFRKDLLTAYKAKMIIERNKQL